MIPIANLVSNLLFSFTAQKVTAAHARMDTRGAFKMTIWLSVYYDFFNKNVRHYTFIVFEV